MRVFVTAKPRSKKERVEAIDETHLVVCVQAPPIDDRANAAIARALAEYFGIAPSRIRLVSGRASRKKIFEVGIDEGTVRGRTRSSGTSG